MASDPQSTAAAQRAEVVRGTLEMLALRLLCVEPMHGWGLSPRLRELSRDVFDVNQGSLYPALQPLLRRGWIKAEWRASENNRRARYYRITAEGRRQHDIEIAKRQRSTAAVNRVQRNTHTEDKQGTQTRETNVVPRPLPPPLAGLAARGGGA